MQIVLHPAAVFVESRIGRPLPHFVLGHVIRKYIMNFGIGPRCWYRYNMGLSRPNSHAAKARMEWGHFHEMIHCTFSSCKISSQGCTWPWDLYDEPGKKENKKKDSSTQRVFAFSPR